MFEVKAGHPLDEEEVKEKIEVGIENEDFIVKYVVTSYFGTRTITFPEKLPSEPPPRAFEEVSLITSLSESPSEILTAQIWDHIGIKYILARLILLSEDKKRQFFFLRLALL